MSLLSAAELLGLPWTARAQAPPETKRIRLYRALTTCFAPQYLAEELLLLEGFSDVEYVEPENTATIAEELARGRFDIGMKTAPYVVPVLDAGVPIVVLAGVHAGCYELFGHDRVRSVRDLKGKTIAVSAHGTSEHVFVSTCSPMSGSIPTRKSAGSLEGHSPTQCSYLLTEEPTRFWHSRLSRRSCEPRRSAR
jgi:NitT/TauT family transport system substrate-binding protein